MTLSTVTNDIQRDRYGRPLVTPPGGGKPTAYTRCTTYVDALEDKYNLQLWQQRMLILGLVDRPDLLLSAAAHRDDKKQLNDIASSAIEAAKAHAAATVGTALHALTERVDAGDDINTLGVPSNYIADLRAYQTATTPLTVLHSETFTVLDDLKIGGTPDRIVEYQGERYIADIKTGSIDFGIGKIAMQLAVYSHSVMYDHTTGQRTPLPGVNGQRGIIIHLPAGTGTCRLVWVDIAAGWEAVQLAGRVREWRRRKNLSTEITTANQSGDDPITNLIAAAPSAEELVAIWVAHENSWTDVHTVAATIRKNQLAQTV